jgi:uncharacterized protein YcbX
MHDLHLSEIYRYPVKSLAGESIVKSRVDAFGLLNDRRWMLVNSEGRFLSQRELPRMALIRPQMESQGLHLQAPGMTPLHCGIPTAEERDIEVGIWQDRCQARTCGEEADAWLSQFLGRACRLVYMAEETVRQVDLDYARPGDRVAFSDGFSLLLISQASLDDLNSRLAAPVSMLNFRPNLVVTGCEPYAEDNWRRIRIGEIILRVVKSCSRCKITTVDPATGETGSEPLKTLSRYRREGKRVLFGQNLIHESQGEFALGMQLEVLD